MADSPAQDADRKRLDALEDLGAGRDYAGAIFGLVGRSQFFAEFTRDDIDVLASYMQHLSRQAAADHHS